MLRLHLPPNSALLMLSFQSRVISASRLECFYQTEASSFYVNFFSDSVLARSPSGVDRCIPGCLSFSLGLLCSRKLILQRFNLSIWPLLQMPYFNRLVKDFIDIGIAFCHKLQHIGKTRKLGHVYGY